MINLACLLKGHDTDDDNVDAVCKYCGEAIVCACDINSNNPCEWLLRSEISKGTS